MKSLLSQIRTVDNTRIMLSKTLYNHIRYPHPNRPIAIIYIRLRPEIKMMKAQLKLPIERGSELRGMNQFSGLGVVSLEFRISPEVGVIA
jgi:hypothetical protein